jgi:hypothetical protein
MALEEYIRKRDFSKTSEPRPLSTQKEDPYKTKAYMRAAAKVRLVGKRR